MKVLHFSSLDGRTGAGVAAARIHLGLLARGIDSRFCVAYPQADLPQAFSPHIGLTQRLERALTFRMDRARLAASQATYDYVLSTGEIGFDMARIVAAERPDVVQLHWIAGNSFRLASLAGVSAPIVWRLSDMWPFCGIQHLETDPKTYIDPPAAGGGLSEAVRRRKQRIYRRIANLTLACPSRWIAGEAARSALLSDRPRVVIPTSCDTEAFAPRDKARARAALGLSAGADIVLVGATSLGTQWKGFDLFIEAVRRLAAARPGRLQVVTFGKDVERLADLAGAADVVNLGAVSDRAAMPLVYSAADVFVAPSRLENLANTVLESLACGTPAAAFAIGGMAEMIDHQRNGWIARPFDPAGLAGGIGWLLDRKQDPAIAAAARAKVIQGFSMGEELDGYINLYQALGAAESRPRRAG